MNRVWGHLRSNNVQPVSRSAEEVNRLERLISARVQPFLLVWARQETAFIHHIKEVPDLIVPFS